MSPGGSEKNAPGVVNASSPTTNSKQETVIQETDIVVAVVAQDLENFGIAKSAITRLMQVYPVEYIREKLAMAQGLVATGSALVSQNPAGWLRKAIEEDYSLPRTFEKYRQHSVSEKKDIRVIQAEPREQHIAEEEFQRAQNVPIGKTVWHKTLEILQADLPIPDVGQAKTQLKGTTLVQVTDTAARIGVPNAIALAWLERRLYEQICKAMKGILGKDLDLQFVTAS
jgi:hypothetical protein